MNTQNREQAKLRAKELKASGMTCEEVVQQLKAEGYKKQEPFYRGGVFYGVFTVRKWCKGIASQAGYRNPRLKTEQERKRKMYLDGVKWRSNNKEWSRAYLQWYRDQFKNKRRKIYEKPFIGDYR